MQLWIKHETGQELEPNYSLNNNQGTECTYFIYMIWLYVHDTVSSAKKCFHKHDMISWAGYAITNLTYQY